jgi:hypothetical protein
MSSAPARVSSLIKLQARCSHRAGETFHRHGALRAMVWVTEDADGVSEFETGCSAPADVSDAVALETLCDEMRADFRHDGVTAYAVAFVGPVTFIGIGLAILAHPPTERRRVVIVEAHNAHNSLVATREIIVGAWPRLGPLQRHTQATGRFRGLLTARAMEAS